MYLEDIFVLEGSRGSGAGRMDWQVLDWNTPARDFYDRRHAQWMKE